MTTDTRINVALIVSNLSYGGAERQVVQIANSLDPSKFTVSIISLSRNVPMASDLKNPSALNIVHRFFKFDISVPFRLAKVLRKLDIDIAHGFLFDAEVAASVAALFRRRMKLILSERNADYSMKKIREIGKTIAMRRASLCIANSKSGAIFHQGITRQPSKKYAVVHNGIDVQRFRPAHSSLIRKQLEIDKEAFVIGMFASFKPQKNHSMMFEVVKQVLTEFAETKFLFVGGDLDGEASEYSARVRKLFDSVETRSACVFVGNSNKVEELYPACDVTVLPSIHEGTPNVALESMACAVPVVVTDVSDNSHFVRDSETGFVVVPGDVSMMVDRLRTLRCDTELRRRIAKRARLVVSENFSLDRMARELEQHYMRVNQG